jgi:fructose-1,6-bisphosphatase/inositol monophosphatase family enzyme
LDDIAEREMEAALKKLSKSGLRFTYFSENEGKIITESSAPDYLFIIDTVDGSRPAKSGFPWWCVNIGVASYSEKPVMRDVEYAFMKEADGTEYYAEKGKGAIITISGKDIRPTPL